MTDNELQELLTRLGKERRNEAVRAWLSLVVQAQRN
ncbi:hypothetical protein LCGC14_1256410 [marine sediment metagenome]|uniref:Uncharacterized protein n=1 Tax=marine sediment metagenome TaxID=412755 RepID=A0A0F9NIL0_9ZZZZ